MNLVIDASVILAVVTYEPSRAALIQATIGADLVAPESLPWEVGNALSSLFRRDLITLEQGLEALQAYSQIPLRLLAVDLASAVRLAHKWKIYAYDAYMIECAHAVHAPLISLDYRLAEVAEKEGIKIIRI